MHRVCIYVPLTVIIVTIIIVVIIIVIGAVFIVVVSIIPIVIICVIIIIIVIVVVIIVNWPPCRVDLWRVRIETRWSVERRFVHRWQVTATDG